MTPRSFCPLVDAFKAVGTSIKIKVSFYYHVITAIKMIG